jgi:type II secretory pathway component PulC
MTAMINQPLTSEEKLLRLIRKKGESPEGKKKKDAAQEPRVLKQGGSKSSYVFVKGLTAVVRLGCVLGVIYLMYLFFQKTNTIELEDKAAVLEETQPSSAFPELKPISYYESVLSQRDIFLAPWEKGVIENATAVSLDVVSMIKVAGIMMDKNPQAIIEDRVSGQTVFLSVGEEVNAAKITAIFADKVVFEYAGGQFELSP